MTVFLRLMQIIAIICALISIPLIFLGIGIVLFVAMVAIAFFDQKAISAAKHKTPMASGIYSGYMFANIAGGLVCAYGVYLLGAFGNVDTTGQPTLAAVVPGLAVVILLTSVLLLVGSRIQRQV